MNALLPWHWEPWARLAQAAREDRLGHAWLITGPHGIGKRLFAEAWAAALLCERPQASGEACGHCRSCVLLAAGSHPDRHLLRPEEGSTQLRVDPIRELCVRLALTPQRGLRQVALLDPADAMNDSAANALLKTLEEPALGTMLLLLADRPWRLPATIRSRCQRLLLPVPTFEQARTWLAGHGHEGADAELALRATGAAPLAALQLLEGPGLALYRRIAELMPELGRGRAEPQAAASELAQVDPELALRWIAEWLSAAYRVRITPGRAREASALRELWQLYEGCLRAQARLSASLRADLTLLELLQAWVELAPRLPPSRDGRAAQGSTPTSSFA